jgi:ADP-dependent NAD(P)H-hydrate dehydratase / NAD(P)H-hydrate epimerase
MKMLSPERMARYDAYAIQTWGIPSAVLMENAGRNTYRLIKERYLSGKRQIAIICGRGNNGGDGFVIARYALADGYRTKVYLLCRVEDLKGDASLNMKLYTSLGGEAIECDNNPKVVKEGLKDADIVVDAIFGTGLSKEVKGKERITIEEINRSGKPVIAVDIPSGIDGTSGVPLGAAVRAIHTFTYGYPKPGQIIYPGADHTGKLTVIDISIPSIAENEIGIDGYVVDGDMVRGFLRPRPSASHKGTYGHAAVIAGSVGKTGAAHMASLAALKIGAGLVTLAIPESLNAIMEVKLTEVMTYPVEDKGRGCFTLSSLKKLVEFLEDKDVVVIGPGLSQFGETMEMVRKLFTEVKKPFVIDADGVNAFQGHLDLLRKTRAEAVLTPHPGEFARIMGTTPQDINADRMGVGVKFVERYGVNLLLKGARSILFTTDGGIFINPTGNPALAKGGSGDILTGFIGGLAAQGHTLAQSSIIGAYLHGYIADTWCADTGSDIDLLAGDLLNGVGRAMKEIERGEERIYIEKSL